MIKNWYSSNKKLFWTLIFCLILRLVFFLLVQPWSPEVQNRLLQKDALEYNQLALTLLHNHQFSYEPNGPPNSFRSPGYPFYIAGFYLIFSDTPWVVILSQTLLDTLTCLFLYLTLRVLLSNKLALISALFYAIDPFLILQCNTLLSDTLFVFFLVLASYFFSLVIKRGSLRDCSKYVLLSGLFFGIATLIRTITIFVPSVLLLVMLLLFRKKLLLLLKYGLILAITFIITLSPWLIRNYIVFDSVALTSSGSLTLIIMYLPPMEMQRRGQPYDTVTNSLLAESDSLMIKAGRDPLKLNGFQKSKYWQQTAYKYISRYPGAFTKSYAVGAIHLFFNLGTGVFSQMLNLNRNTEQVFDINEHPNFFELIKTWFKRKPLTEILIGLIIAAFLFLTYIPALFGLVISWKYFDRAFLTFCVLMVLYFVILTGPQGLVRYKLPAIPFYLPFTAIGIDYLFKWKIMKAELVK